MFHNFTLLHEVSRHHQVTSSSKNNGMYSPKQYTTRIRQKDQKKKQRSIYASLKHVSFKKHWNYLLTMVIWFSVTVTANYITKEIRILLLGYFLGCLLPLYVTSCLTQNRWCFSVKYWQFSSPAWLKPFREWWCGV